MAKVWMWGWEIGAGEGTYTATGWAVFGNPARRHFSDTDPFQPASGFGGGRYNLLLAQQDFGQGGRVRTPTAGPNSIGVWQRFILHTAYKREGNSSSNDQNSRWIGLLSNGTPIIEVVHTATIANVSPMGLRVNGVLLGTSTTTYTGSQPYHRIVLDVDGAAGDYDVYINGTLEISVSGSAQTFASINEIEYTAGVVEYISTRGGRHDHTVLFDAGNRAIGDINISNQPLNNETVVIGAQTYTFKTTLTPAANEVLIGGSASSARKNLTDAINLGPGSGTTYASTTTLNSDVTAEIDQSLPGVHVFAKVIGVASNAVTTTDTLSGVGDGWASGTLSGGDSDPTTDLALALGDIFIQGLRPNSDVSDGGYLNVGGPNNGTNVDLFNNVNDGANLTDFIETLAGSDKIVLGHEDRANINAGWAPSEVHAVQTLQITRGSGTITDARLTLNIPSLGETISDAENVSASGRILNSLRDWRNANVTTDVDGVESGNEV